MNTMSFINSDLNKQAQPLQVTFSRTTRLNFYHQILVRNAQMYIRLENLVY